MIIFGTRGVKSTIKEGQFHCPQCEAQQRYRHRKVTRFFTLYFIPIIPLGQVGEYVECTRCKGTYIPKVLNYRQAQPSAKMLSEYEKAVKHCMVMIMLADGEIDPTEMAMVEMVVNKFSHNKINQAQLAQYVKEVQNNPEDISTYLRRVKSTLNKQAKEYILRCALMVAAADGHIDESEIALIKGMAHTMEMTPAQVNVILQDINKLQTPQRA